MGSLSSQSQTLTATTENVRVVTADTSKPQLITAQNVKSLFPGCVDYLAQPSAESSKAVEKDLEGHQQKQVKAMEEICILLDTKDNPIGGANKYICMYSTDCPVLVPRYSCTYAASSRPSNGQYQ